MASNIVLKTYAAGDNNQGSVTPQNDALIYQAAVPMNGLFFGGTITLLSANVLHVAAGMGIIGGRFFEILESEIAVLLSASGDLLGRLYIHLDLSNADNPIEIKSYTGASLPALSGDPNLNVSSGSFDMELCTFDINELTISNIVQTFPTITAANNQIRRATAYAVNDLVFCQSASNSLIFVCTTDGTTAVQEPTGYATITDGNTITDGTAVFKAYSVKGVIDQIDYNTANISGTGDEYSSSKSYKTGAYVIYGNELYCCTTDCSAGSWATNQSCFTKDTLTNAVNKIRALGKGTHTLNARLLGAGYNAANGNTVNFFVPVILDTNKVSSIAIVSATEVSIIADSLINITSNLSNASVSYLSYYGFIVNVPYTSAQSGNKSVTALVRSLKFTCS